MARWHGKVHSGSCNGGTAVVTRWLSVGYTVWVHEHNGRGMKLCQISLVRVMAGRRREGRQPTTNVLMLCASDLRGKGVTDGRC